MPAPAEIQQDSDAAWAIRFRERGTNAASRARRDRQDEQIGAADYNERQRAARERSAFLESKEGAGARDLMKQRSVEANQARMRDISAQRLQFDQEKQAFAEDMKLNNERLQIMNAQRGMAKERRDAERAGMILEHTEKAESEMDEIIKSGLVPGSPGFAAATMQALLNNPLMEKSVRDAFLQTARIEDDPDLLVGQALELGLEPSGARVVNGKLVPTFKKPGVEKPIGSAVAKPVDPEKEIREARKEWLSALEKLNKLGEEEQPDLVAEVRILKDNLDRLRSGGTKPGVAGTPLGGTVGGNPPVTLPKVTSQEQFNALPPGSQYINSAGQTATKPNEG